MTDSEQRGQQYPQDEQPLVSIITSTFNAAELLLRCMASVEAQDYPRIEHIVVDGASKDGTVKILEQATWGGRRWMSEPDTGIYDAWNKGLALAKGEWIAFLGSDDILLPGAVSAMMSFAAEHPDAEYISAHVRHIGKAGSRVIGEAWSWPRYQKFMCAAHVGSMHRRSLFAAYGAYDTSYRITADYEFLLRPKDKLRAGFLPRIIADMQDGGASDSSAALIEAARAKRETGARSKVFVQADTVVANVSFHLRRLLNRFRFQRSPERP